MTNSPVLRIMRKELQLFFQSPAAWLFLASFSAITLFIFFWLETFFARNVADLRPLFSWMPLLLIFLSSAITMRSWSEERRQQTLEFCHSLPVSLWRFVLGKFLACFTLLLLALSTTAPLAITIDTIANLDRGPVLAGYLATALLGAAYISIGLYVSARTDNAVVALIGSCLISGIIYLLGSPALTSFFADSQAEIMRQFGTGSRFNSIVAGVIDFRDLWYYISLVVVGLTLTVYQLERERWASGGQYASRHRRWQLFVLLIAANIGVSNIWLAPVNSLRLDVTAGKQHSLSLASKEMVSRLQEPLLIRAYLSERTHPLLSPLVPKLRDLLAEYEVVGGDRLRLEIVDPTKDPQLEQEANDRYGIYSTPFQVNDRHQSALVNAYFNILVQYGDEHRSLSFSDLIEVHSSATGAKVQLRNPEFEITRTLREVLQAYRSEGSIFEGIQDPVELRVYVSADSLLPPALLNYKQSMLAQLEELIPNSAGKLSFRLINPDAENKITQPALPNGLDLQSLNTLHHEDEPYYFYLTLNDGKQVLQLPSDNFQIDNFLNLLEAGLKRFSTDLTRTVALVTPDVPLAMQQHHLGGPTFRNLERAISRDYYVVQEDLSDGQVSSQVDVLAVIAPMQLDAQSVLAIDQFLMRGGTVMLATSAFTIEIAQGQIKRQPWPSGLGNWLQHFGIRIAPELVLDLAAAPFPTPVKRRHGDTEFDKVQLINNPYLPDLRGDSLNNSHSVTANLPQLTMAWPSPIEIDRVKNVRYTPLLKSSARAWRSSQSDITPWLEGDTVHFADSDSAKSSELLAVIVQGDLSSGVDTSAAQRLIAGHVLQRAAESARLLVFASNDFMDDQILRASTQAAGGQYLGPLELFINALDWALQDDQLIHIRSTGNYNRALPAMDISVQRNLEYMNYAMALASVLLLMAMSALARKLRRRKLRRGLMS